MIVDARAQQRAERWQEAAEALAAAVARRARGGLAISDHELRTLGAIHDDTSVASDAVALYAQRFDAKTEQMLAAARDAGARGRGAA